MKKPDPDILKAFSTELYLEHLEEASFLYDQRGVLLQDPAFSWLDIGAVEDRFETHIDALLVGGGLALDICEEKAETGDSGEMHAALTVFCRHKRLDLVQQVLDSLDTQDKDSVRAVGNALKHEWQDSWNDQLTCMLKESRDACLAVLPKVAGFCRLPVHDALVHVLPACPECFLHHQLWSMGRLNTACAPAALLPFLEHSETTIRAAAALSLSRMGISLIDSLPCDGSNFEFWQLMHIGLTAGKPHVLQLLSAMGAVENTGDIALVLGVLGDTAAVEPLIEQMATYRYNDSIALALNLITGADLYHTVLLSDPEDEDELFDNENETLIQDQPSEETPSPAGTEVVRLWEDPVAWQEWWYKNRARFQPGDRYRNGMPYNPSCLLDNLRSDKSPPLVRQIAAEELVTRYAINVPFETDMRVSDQLHALNRIEKMTAAKADSIISGAWYFAGRLIS